MKPTCTPKGRGLGWIADQPDQRDRIFIAHAELVSAVREAPSVDLRTQSRPVFDQGQLGSCTANALAAAFDFDRHKQGKPFMTPSRLFIYWNERYLEGTATQDAGARLRDGVKVLATAGVPPESAWPYVPAEFAVKPPAATFASAEKNQALTYQRITTPATNPVQDMLACLAAGYPFVTGISVYESFESTKADKTGHIPLPGVSEQPLGGHAILIVGYDTKSQLFTFQNSWGTSWGDKGFGYIPFSYLTNRGLAQDMWTIRTVEA